MTNEEKKGCGCYRCAAEVECDKAKKKADAVRLECLDALEKLSIVKNQLALKDYELRAAVDALRPFSTSSDWNPLERVDRNEARAFVAAYDAKHPEYK